MLSQRSPFTKCDRCSVSVLDQMDTLNIGGPHSSARCWKGSALTPTETKSQCLHVNELLFFICTYISLISSTLHTLTPHLCVTREKFQWIITNAVSRLPRLAVQWYLSSENKRKYPSWKLNGKKYKQGVKASVNSTSSECRTVTDQKKKKWLWSTQRQLGGILYWLLSPQMSVSVWMPSRFNPT